MEHRDLIFVLKFFRSSSGDLICRATHAQSQESWTIDHADQLWRLVCARYEAIAEVNSPKPA